MTTIWTRINSRVWADGSSKDLEQESSQNFELQSEQESLKRFDSTQTFQNFDQNWESIQDLDQSWG